MKETKRHLKERKEAIRLLAEKLTANVGVGKEGQRLRLLKNGKDMLDDIKSR